MKHLTFGLLGTWLCALLIGGCVYDDGRGYRGGGGYQTDCHKFTACHGCTLAVGCGWCSSGNDGICVSAPNQCAGATTFSWTWEASGCPGAAADAGAAADGWVEATPAVDAPADVTTASDLPATADAGDGGAADGASDAAAE